MKLQPQLHLEILDEIKDYIGETCHKCLNNDMVFLHH